MVRQGICAGLLGVLVLGLAGCSAQPAAVGPPPRPTARARALQAAHVLVPYGDAWRTFTLRRPQTWVVLDGRSTPRFARALGDGVRFFEPVTATDPDAGSSGKLWIDVLPARPHVSPREVLLQPFVDAGYPPEVLSRMRLAPYRLGGVSGSRLLTLPSKRQVTLLLVRWGHYDYRLTVFGAIIPLEVDLALRTWRFLGPTAGTMERGVRA